MKNKLLAACLLLVGCAPPDLVSKRGVKFYLDGSTRITQTVVDQSEDWLVDTLGMHGFGADELGTALSEASVQLTHQGPLSCPEQPNGMCEGYQDGALLFVRDDIVCTGTLTTLGHEELHWIHIRLRGVIDFEHDMFPTQWSDINPSPFGCR